MGHYACGEDGSELESNTPNIRSSGVIQVLLAPARSPLRKGEKDGSQNAKGSYVQDLFLISNQGAACNPIRDTPYLGPYNKRLYVIAR